MLRLHPLDDSLLGFPDDPGGERHGAEPEHGAEAAGRQQPPRSSGSTRPRTFLGETDRSRATLSAAVVSLAALSRIQLSMGGAHSMTSVFSGTP
jgi:hypothetical protein